MEYKLASLIKTVAEGEMDIEVAKHSLFEAVGGNTDVAFDKLNKYNREKLTPFEISEFLNENGVPNEDDEIRLFMNYYDKSGETALSKEDFRKAITPKVSAYTRPLGVKARENELYGAIASYILKELEFLRNTFPLRRALLNTNLYTTFDFFKSLDPKQTGSFNYTDLDNFLQKNGILLNNAELLAVFRRCDRDEKNRVTFFDFQTQILPDLGDVKVLQGGLLKSFHKAILHDEIEQMRSNVKAEEEEKDLKGLSKGEYVSKTYMDLPKYYRSYVDFQPKHFQPGYQPLHYQGHFPKYHTQSDFLKDFNEYNSYSDPYIKAKADKTVPTLMREYQKAKDEAFRHLIDNPEMKAYDARPVTATDTYKSAYPNVTEKKSLYTPPAYYDYYPYRSDAYMKYYHLKETDTTDFSKTYSPYQYYSPYYSNNVPLRYSKYYLSLQHASKPYVEPPYRHSHGKDDENNNTPNKYIPPTVNRKHFEQLKKSIPDQFYMSSTGKKYFLGEDKIPSTFPRPTNYEHEIAMNKTQTRDLIRNKEKIQQDPLFGSEIKRRVAPDLYNSRPVASPEKLAMKTSNLYNGNDVRDKYNGILKEN